MEEQLYMNLIQYTTHIRYTTPIPHILQAMQEANRKSPDPDQIQQKGQYTVLLNRDVRQHQANQPNHHARLKPAGHLFLADQRMRVPITQDQTGLQ